MSTSAPEQQRARWRRLRLLPTQTDYFYCGTLASRAVASDDVYFCFCDMTDVAASCCSERQNKAGPAACTGTLPPGGARGNNQRRHTNIGMDFCVCELGGPSVPPHNALHWRAFTDTHTYVSSMVWLTRCDREQRVSECWRPRHVCRHCRQQRRRHDAADG